MSIRRASIVMAALVSVAVVAALADEPGQAKITELQARLSKDIDGSAASDKVKQFAKDTLVPLCTNPVFVAETTAQNNKKVALDEIKKIDKEWSAAEEELPIQKEKCDNACAKEIKKIVGANSAIGEAFVMDNQGAVVGENTLTSDYWQGDEEKWTGSFKDGRGGVDVGKEKFDKSANASLQQISLPIIDKDGKVIGAVTWGVRTDKL